MDSTISLRWREIVEKALIFYFFSSPLKSFLPLSPPTREKRVIGGNL